MARYIDLEELERRINMYVKKPPHSSREIKETTEWCKDECIRQAYCMPTANVAPRADIAREIFEEIEKQLARYAHIHRYAEEAHKSTEEYADGSPVEMTSVWDACQLEHNGYDDYETMCQLQDNIGNIEKSRLLKEFECDIAQLRKKYESEGADNGTN